MRAETDELFLCAWCGESNEVVLDLTGGTEQSFVVDCEICCRPNLLKVRVDVDEEVWSVEVSRES